MNSMTEQARKLQEEAVRIRRDLHAHPESGLCEYRTASLVIRTLCSLGWHVCFGREVADSDYFYKLPEEAYRKACAERAIRDGADPDLVAQMKDGMTGVVAEIKTGIPGNTVAFRFDMDCNAIEESQEEEHRPAREGFASCYPKLMHACGHDGHTAIGLTLARLLAENRDSLCGTIRLIFQPAEEGVRGALPMVKMGLADDVDYFFGGHIGITAKEKHSFSASVGDFFAVKKYEAVFTGRSSHAGLSPHEGKNALLAAAQATLALHALPRHGDGTSRINVGIFNGGTSINVVPDRAMIGFETRGETTDINRYLSLEAERILKGAAEMYGVSVEYHLIGEALSYDPDPVLAEEVAKIASQCGHYEKINLRKPMHASEDCTFFLNRVKEQGKKAAYLLFGTELADLHHSSHFDFDEEVLWESVALLAELAVRYTKK